LVIDNLDEETGESLWIGTNGHANSVLGGTGSSSANSSNVFDQRGGTGWTDNNPTQHWANFGDSPDGNGPGDNGSWGFRDTDAQATNAPYDPTFGGSSENWEVDEWGVDESGATKQNQFHKFSCSKCHNPHASRLPKLMITNCLDTKHNTWDNQFQYADAGSNNTGRELANWTSAQNCHRYGQQIGNSANTTEYDNTVEAAAPTAGVGAGWNKVTPWASDTNGGE
jgi:hypothetical protein